MTAQSYRNEADTLRRIVLEALGFLNRGAPEAEREAMSAKMCAALGVDPVDIGGLDFSDAFDVSQGARG